MPVPGSAHYRSRLFAPILATAVLAATITGMGHQVRAEDGPHVLAGPRFGQDCDAAIRFAFFYTSRSETTAIDAAIGRRGGDCLVHAASRLTPDEPADGAGPWTWAELPEAGDRTIVLGFLDTEGGTLGWVQLDNRSDAWYYRTNADPAWQAMMNRERRVLDWDGVAIALYNPPSEGDWSPYDIWYRFAERDTDGPARQPAPMAEATPTVPPRG